MGAKVTNTYDEKAAAPTDAITELLARQHMPGAGAYWEDIREIVSAALAACAREALEQAAQVIDREIALREKFDCHMEPIDKLALQIRALKPLEAAGGKEKGEERGRG